MIELLPLAETAIPPDVINTAQHVGEGGLDGEVKWLVIGGIGGKMANLGRRYIMAEYDTGSLPDRPTVERPEIPQAWYVAAAVLGTAATYLLTDSLGLTAAVAALVCAIVASVTLFASRRSAATDDVERLADA